MKLSTDSFNFQTTLNSSELTNCLSERTEAGKLFMKSTSKDFIGTVSEQEFKLINSWFPIGVACVITGHLNTQTDQVELTTSLHRGFRILFNVWAVVIAILILFGLSMSNDLTNWIAGILGFIFMATLFRFFLHGVYVLARNRSTQQLSELFENG